MRFVILLPLAAALVVCAAGEKFRPGEVWLDAAGQPIQAHSAGIVQVGREYYWYGEDKTLGNFNKTGISCYRSRDLHRWTRVSTALPKEALPEEFRDTGICERAKVLYNRATKKFVMWMHLDDRRYHVASAGVAVADRPEGPFRFVGKQRPVKFDFGYRADDPTKQAELGGTYRDMNLFLDDDGKAYVFYASEDNKTMYVVRLNGEYTGPETPQVEGKTWARVFPGALREAPAPFKHNGKYFVITSGCTGWRPNEAQYAVAPSPLGPWTVKGNPVVGAGAETTFDAQSTFVLPAPGKRPGSFIFLADRWNEKRLEDSRYVWLPFRVGPGDEIRIEFLTEWDMSWFDR